MAVFEADQDRANGVAPSRQERRALARRGLDPDAPPETRSQTIATCVSKAKRYLQACGIPGEVLVADNGSVDGSQDAAAAHGARVIEVAGRGYGSALVEVDDLQPMTCHARAENRQVEVSEVSGGLKILARETGEPDRGRGVRDDGPGLPELRRLRSPGCGQ